MVNINHRIGILVPLENVFKAISTEVGIAKWWTESTSLETDNQVRARFLNFEGIELGSMKFEIFKTSETEVKWTFLEGPEEWIGTDVIFDLKKEGEYAILLFSHSNWKEEVEFKSHCSMKWAIFLLSLKQYTETGKGNPSPEDFKIDNWN